MSTFVPASLFLIFVFFPPFRSSTLAHPTTPTHLLRSAACPIILTSDPPSNPPISVSPEPSFSPEPFPSLEPPVDCSRRPPSDRIPPLSLRVFNGDLAFPFIRSALVQLQMPRDHDISFCSGVLLSRRWVLTVARCGPSNLSTAAIGLASVSPFDIRFPVRRVFIHPGFSSGEPDNDIALVQLAIPAPASASFMALSVNPALPLPLSFVRLVGYGRPRSPTLRQVDVPVTPSNFCEQAYSNIDLETQFCGGYFTRLCSGWYVPLLETAQLSAISPLNVGSEGTGSAPTGALFDNITEMGCILS